MQWVYQLKTVGSTNWDEIKLLFHQLLQYYLYTHINSGRELVFMDIHKGQSKKKKKKKNTNK